MITLQDNKKKKVDQPSLVGLWEAPYSKTSTKYKNITDSLVYFIVKDLQPYNVVNDEGFSALVKTLDSRYVLP